MTFDNMKENSAFKASLWSLIEKFSTQIVGFAIGIVLARLLTPNDYGIVGITTIFIALGNVFIDSGFANGLIRKKDRTEADLSTAFIFNVVVGVTAYFLLFICSPYIAKYFNEQILTTLLRVVGLIMLFNSLCVVPTAILTSKLAIKEQTFINLLSQIPAGLISIYLAYRGFGVYALGIQAVLSSMFKIPMLFVCVKWSPSLVFCKQSFSYLWSFGSKLLAANLIGTFFEQVYSILIGKYIGKDDLGYFSKAQGLNQNVNSISTGVVQKVALPVLARYQSDKTILVVKFRDIMRLLVLVIASISAFLSFASNEIIVILWTDKWLDSAYLFKLLVIGAMFNPIGQLSLSLMQAVGNTALILKLELPKKIIYCVYLAIGFIFGVKGLVISAIFISATAALINMWATKAILPYSYRHQLWDVLKYIIIAYPMAYCVHSVVSFFNPLMNVSIFFVLYFTLYVVTLIVFKDKMLEKYVIDRLLKH